MTDKPEFVDMISELTRQSRRRVMPRERPVLATALVIQVALIAIGGALIELPLPRTVLLGVLLIEAIALPRAA